MIIKERIGWIDTAKFLGIFAIYLGHFSPEAGNAVSYVFAYHVPLFFFLSGCMATYDVQSSFIKYVVKKAKSILVPFYGFALLSLALFVIKSNGDINGLKYHLEMLKMGV